MVRGFVLILCSIACLAAASGAHASDPDPKEIEFFETRIRPVLIEHCFSCHSSTAASAGKLKGGLQLDHRSGLTTGGDSGPAIDAEDASESLLLEAVRSTGGLKMPPNGKLPDTVIADLERWVQRDSPGLPETAPTAIPDHKQVGMSIEEGRRFWAYRKPVVVDPPPWDGSAGETSGTSGTDATIDRFVLARLRAAGMSPAPTADRAVLVRRLYFDLVGYPPSPEEVDAFVADSSPDAYARLVDRLLAAPQFGERWGRHWLDVARFAESVTLRGLVYHNAWRYRDYVIDSFNRDVPFNQFVREQVAGDLLPAASYSERSRNLVATTYLALGNWNLEEQDKHQLRMDVVDEQLDVIGKGILAQTITCARCHDHKFDPIPTADYYALAGFLRSTKSLEHANVSAWLETPLPGSPEEETAWKRQEETVASLQARIAAEQAKGVPASESLPVKDVAGIVVDDAMAVKVGVWQPSTSSKSYIGDGYVHDLDSGKGTKTLTFQPESVPAGRYEVRLAYTAGTNRSSEVPVTVFSADGEKTILVDMKAAPPIGGRYISLGEYRFETAGQAYVIVSNEKTRGHVIADAVVWRSLENDPGPDRVASPGEQAARTAAAAALKQLEAELKNAIETGPRRPKAMSVSTESTVEDSPIHVRGSVHNLGPVVPRGFLQVTRLDDSDEISTLASAAAKSGSGRERLADWLASRDNPLTARVYVNRVWHWLFGAGLVRSVDNFGTTGELPSHPELLDTLAVQFMADGWSTKRLVRRIVLSQTYQRSSRIEEDSPLLAADPENRLLGRANRRRLEAESLRDAMLVVSGAMDFTPGGKTFSDKLVDDYGYVSRSTRRSVYLPAFRNAPEEILSVFDPADPSTVTGQRNRSVTPQQALYLLNHPFPAEQAARAATRVLSQNLETPRAHVEYCYRLVLGRSPTGHELQAAAAGVNTHSSPQAAYTLLIHALFASPDFRVLE